MLPNINILLADDDQDDCLFFKEALEELELPTKLTLVHDGEKLMQLLLNSSKDLFHVLFLDLNMPRKNGFSCLEEIKNNDLLKSLPIFILSTSFDKDISDLLYKNGAQKYICKPADFYELKKIIRKALLMLTQRIVPNSTKENFLLSSL